MLGWQALLKNGGYDLIIASHSVELFYFESPNVVSERHIMLFLLVEEMVSLLLDHLVGSILLCEDES